MQADVGVDKTEIRMAAINDRAPEVWGGWMVRRGVATETERAGRLCGFRHRRFEVGWPGGLAGRILGWRMEGLFDDSVTSGIFRFTSGAVEIQDFPRQRFPTNPAAPGPAAHNTSEAREPRRLLKKSAAGFRG